jgi:chemotaxis protein MotA
MLVIVGAVIVFVSTIGGFMIAGGQPMVLLHVSEFVVILGVAAGVLIIASPGHVLKEIIHKIKSALTGKAAGKAEYFELLKLLYELFMTGRRNGLIALEEHVMDPKSSSIFQKYPSLLNHHERLQFLCNGLKPVIDGKIKPDQLEDLMAAELSAKEEEAGHPVHILHLVGDSLPGIGIVNPLANRIVFNNSADQLCLKCIMQAVAGFAKGLAPLTAVEIARRSLDSSVQPGADELEAAVKNLGTGK